jgi:pyridoxine 5-phosphate synthase
MACIPEMVAIAVKTRPNTVCLVPERRQEVTTEGGLDVESNESKIRATILELNRAGIEVSLFIGPEIEQVEAAARVGSQFIELHTGAFAEEFRRDGQATLQVKRLVKAAECAVALGIRVNAGHGITVKNVGALFIVPWLEELNIGHSIVSRAMLVGMEAAVREMIAAMAEYPPQSI